MSIVTGGDGTTRGKSVEFAWLAGQGLAGNRLSLRLLVDIGSLRFRRVYLVIPSVAPSSRTGAACRFHKLTALWRNCRPSSRRSGRRQINLPPRNTSHGRKSATC